MAKSKKIAGKIKLHVPAGQANPSPPVGPALSQFGANIMEFCKQFNAKTSKEEPGLTTPVEITVFEDKSFKFETKTPPASVLLKKTAKVAKGSGEPQKIKVAKITKAQVEEIAKKKMADLNTDTLNAAVKIIEGTARSMGIVVEG